MIEKIFLLGGYDLEMLEIKKLLKEQGIRYADKKLNWENARLKMYDDEIKRYADKTAYTLYGVELDEDNYSKLPENYHKIDHHNSLSNMPSSIEQVCALLGTTMSRHQQLVAANDKAYIPGMIAMRATDAEIADIRLKDRQAQGVTPEDECLAKQALKNKKQEGDLIIVYSRSNRFSPICDSLYPCSKLLIYTIDELVYYGKEKDKLVSLFAEEIESGNMYHGGGDTGFIGTGKGKNSNEKLESIRTRILKEVVTK